jgi:hypothetical protein
MLAGYRRGCAERRPKPYAARRTPHAARRTPSAMHRRSGSPGVRRGLYTPPAPHATVRRTEGHRPRARVVWVHGAYGSWTETRVTVPPCLTSAESVLPVSPFCVTHTHTHTHIHRIIHTHRMYVRACVRACVYLSGPEYLEEPAPPSCAPLRVILGTHASRTRARAPKASARAACVCILSTRRRRPQGMGAVSPHKHKAQAARLGGGSHKHEHL